MTNVKKKQKLLTPDFTLIFIQCVMNTLLHRKTNLLQFTVIVRKKYRQYQCILKIACEERVLFVCVDFYDG
jgi:hypothetical protein